jgi:membrane protein DedA with SNARE-associated domain
MDANFFYELVGRYGLYAVFFLAMVEGDITLLMGGVLARSAFFGELSFIKVLCAGTLGGALSDQAAYAVGRVCGTSVREFRFYRAARPRIERLTDKFGSLSIFLSKYIYGLRWGSCVFYGVAHMPYLRFLLLSFASCFLWVAVLSGAGYFFSSAVLGLIGDFERLGKLLLVIVVVGIVGFYLVERFWLSKKVEEADPEKIQKLEQAAEEKLQEIGQELKEHLPPLGRRMDSSKSKSATAGRNESEGD